jgi:hypothetical protein
LIRILSNHGNENLLSLSEIDVLTTNHAAAAVIKVEVVGEYRPNPRLAYLVDREFTKRDESKMWRHDWPPQPPASTVDLLFTIECNDRIESMRFWPDVVDPTRNPKKVTVYLDDTPVYTGDIDHELASVISLDKPVEPELLPDVKELICSQLDSSERNIRDPEGHVIPSPEFSKLEIQILDTYVTSHTFALSMIRVHDIEGHLFNFAAENVAFTARNCGACSDVTQLFARKACNPAHGFDPWRGTIGDDVPTITARFEAPIRALAIEIVNVDPTEEDDDLLSEKAQVLLDNQSFWVGTLNRRTPLSTDERPNSTYVFTAITPEIRRIVTGQAQQTTISSRPKLTRT